MKKIAWCTLLISASSAAWACGGQSSDTTGAEVTDEGGESSGSSSLGSSGEAVGSSGTTGVVTPVPVGGSGATTAESGTTQPAASGATSTPPAGDGGGPAHLAVPTITATMCGSSTCTATQECCISLPTGQTAMTTVACADIGKCPANSFPSTCSSAASCNAGDVCCAAVSFTGRMEDITGSCQSSCTPAPDAGRGAADLQLCATDDECPMGDTCEPQQGLDLCVRAPPMRAPRDGGAPVRPTFDGGGGGRGFFDGGARRTRDAAP